MAVIRVNKTKDYTVMSNSHFKERGMSLKAKGLLSIMLSLPDDWDYSINGLVTLSKDGKDSVMKALNELEDFGYLVRTQTADDKGRFAGYEYNIYENPITESPYTEKPNTEKPIQLNTKKLNTKKSNTNRFIAPTLEEVEAYCRSRGNKVDAKKFYDYFTAGNWTDAKGNKVKNWKQKLITWEAYSNEGTRGHTIEHKRDGSEYAMYD